MLRITAGVVAGLLLAAAPAQAQRGVEVGFDAGVGVRINDGTIISASTVVPATAGMPLLMPGAFRIGVPLGTRATLEPRVGFALLKPDGSDALTAVNMGLGVPIDLQSGQRGGYLRPFGTFFVLSGDGDSINQFSAGAGIGYRAAVADRMAIRLEAYYEHAFESDRVAGGENVGLLIGLSMFTR